MFTGKSTPMKTAVLVRAREEDDCLEGPKNINGAGGGGGETYPKDFG